MAELEAGMLARGCVRVGVVLFFGIPVTRLPLKPSKMAIPDRRLNT